MKNELTPIWHWENPLPSSVLAQVIAEGDQAAKTKGTIGEGDAQNNIRNSDIVMFPGWHWFCGVLMNFAISANDSALWNRSLTRPECLQYADYAADQFYDWHIDSAILSATPMNRKLSVVCMLSDASDYEGGELWIENMQDGIRLTKGSIIVFPSNVRHKVAPVTSGIRKTAISWILGPSVW